ncbi:SDR family oxidoreductase [Alicyclobacillus tolerans]|uniref:SDR family NAD(P)-dependent oxidoreductase n=1 Tax=Alicyclobacillus tolerans TaxID=90970 RepID=UPI001F34F433|nr:SDR family oxidoreductase [Alicyclobacillus tolerans]MCF8566825.1 SDR family oxidoreductase [Alicyclobacillus tolerans]
MRLKERVALVTGAGSGIGRAIATRFAKEGALVLVCDLNLAAAEEVVQQITSEGGHAQARQVDVSDEILVKALFQSLREDNIALDTLVNNAGMGIAAKCVETSMEDWSRTLAVNLTGTFLMCREALTGFLERRRGVIVNLSSAAALAAVHDRAAYIASKSGVIGLTKSIALDYAQYGIRANAICPGTIDTPWVGRITAGYDDPVEAKKQMEARQLLGRFGQPEEIAGAALYLASEDATFVTGTELVVDGGFTVR